MSSPLASVSPGDGPSEVAVGLTSPRLQLGSRSLFVRPCRSKVHVGNESIGHPPETPDNSNLQLGNAAASRVFKGRSEPTLPLSQSVPLSPSEAARKRVHPAGFHEPTHKHPNKLRVSLTLRPRIANCTTGFGHCKTTGWHIEEFCEHCHA